jgi:hypothetical protein
MNEKFPTARPILFYSVVIVTAVAMAVIFSPTPDLVSVGLMALLTVLSSVVIGILVRLFSGRFPRMGKSNVILPASIGIFGSILGLILINLAFRMISAN